MDYRQLLKKYINHVGEYEGSTFLADHKRSSYPGMPEFTDEEWEKLKELETEPLVISAVTHNCSCHPKNAGPCGICKELGCEVWDFNHVAILEPDATCDGTRRCTAVFHANDCPKWTEE